MSELGVGGGGEGTERDEWGGERERWPGPPVPP